MVRYLYKAWSEAAPQRMRYFAIEVDAVEDRWMSTCREVDREGDAIPGAGAVAPRFYGVTPDQAHRRMRDVLENNYDRFEPVQTPLDS